MTTYDYNTGKPLAPGQAQSVYNTATGQKIGDPSQTTPTGLSTMNSGVSSGSTTTGASTPSNTSSSSGAQFSTTGLDPASFTNVLRGVESSFANSNSLIDAKNLLLKGLFTSPLTPDQISKLPPDMQTVYNSGNKDAIELQVQALNEQIQSGTNNFASSMNYLVSGYQTSVTQAEKQKQDAFDNLIKIAGSFVDPKSGTVNTAKMSSAFQALYPGVDMSGVISQLQGMMPTTEYNKYIYQGTNGNGNTSGNSLMDAIVAQESGGSYTATSPAGALGKYQIMPEHLADLGLDPNNPADIQKFLNSPELQDQEYQTIISNLSTKYNGDTDKILAAYYGGDTAVQKLGTPAADVPQGKFPSINQYIAQVKSKMTPDSSSQDITPDSPDYNIVTKLATGKLTFDEFISLVGRGSDAKTKARKTAIFNAASKLNPEFSPADFSIGLKIASNPKIVQTNIAIDAAKNTLQGLISLSDQATREGAPAVNKYLLSAGYSTGNDLYARFMQATGLSADELSGVLGYGSATDAKLALSQSLLDPNLSPTSFAANVNYLIGRIDAKKSIVGSYEGPYSGSGGTDGTTGGSSGTTQNVLDPSQIPDGYYQASDGLLYKK